MKKNVDYKKKFNKMRIAYFKLAEKYVNGSDKDYELLYNNLLIEQKNLNIEICKLKKENLAFREIFFK